MIEGDDLGDLIIEEAVHRAATGCTIGELAGGPPVDPAVVADLAQLELVARSPEAPTGVGSVSDEIEQGCLGDLIAAARDSATQPQRSFPSTNINLTAISLGTSPSRATPARAASSSSRSRT